MAGRAFSRQENAKSPVRVESPQHSAGVTSTRRIEFVYVHNCNESANVDKELRTAAQVAAGLMGRDGVAVGRRETGLAALESLCLSCESEILVEDESVVAAENAIEETGEGWRSIMVSVPGDWLHERHAKHGPRLFSANYRDFLGVRNSMKNINNGIKTTVQTGRLPYSPFIGVPATKQALLAWYVLSPALNRSTAPPK